MAEVKWIKITTDIFDDEKILLIESMPDAYAIITVWFKLLCLAGKMNNSGVFLMNERIAYTDKMLATIFTMKEATVTMALQTFEQFGMIEIVDGVITIPNWGKHQNLDQLETKKAYMKKYMQDYRAKQKQITGGKTNSKTNSKTNVSSIDKEREINKEKEIDNNILCKSTPKKADIDDVFERLWRLYPNKKGKGQVSDSRKKAIYAIGYDEMSRAIKRYTDDLKRDSWRKAQNGSTFFNSGYIDYLDSNYIPAEDERTVENGTDKQDNIYDKLGTVL